MEDRTRHLWKEFQGWVLEEAPLEKASQYKKIKQQEKGET